MPKPIITTDDIRAVQPGSVLQIPVGAIITDLARELAETNQIRLEDKPLSLSDEATQPADRVPTVALGSDHGPSFPMKEALKPLLQELGFAVLDCGTHSVDAVDYPDIAYAVAKQVANGVAWRGIVIDAAGIGSCVAANKVPGIRAALCYNQAGARNSREHNDANILTLGAAMIDLNLAKQIVETWLKTDFGGGRHQRRVNKIIQIEQRFSRG